MGDYSYAETLFRTAARVQPDDIGAFINLGRVLKAQERFEEAEKVSFWNVLLIICPFLLYHTTVSYLKLTSCIVVENDSQ